MVEDLARERMRQMRRDAEEACQGARLPNGSTPSTSPSIAPECADHGNEQSAGRTEGRSKLSNSSR